MLRSLLKQAQTHNSCYTCHKCFHRQSKQLLKKKGHLNLINAYKSSSSKAASISEWNEPKGRKTGIYLYNALTRRKDELILPNRNHLSW